LPTAASSSKSATAVTVSLDALAAAAPVFP
jgi:hypothetical protein